MDVTVELEIQRKKGNKTKIVKKVVVQCKNVTDNACQIAELEFCNSYINRDTFVGIFDNLNHAKEVAGLKIKSKTIN